MATVDHRATVATRKIGGIPNFAWFKWECVGDDAAVLTGCVSSGVYTRGPRKGRPKYDGEPRSVVVTDAEMLAERRRYEAETGNCAECGGDGKMFAGWHRDNGTKWRDCVKCGSTGKPVTRDAVREDVEPALTDPAR